MNQNCLDSLKKVSKTRYFKDSFSDHDIIQKEVNKTINKI
jgi:hypothetical protein